MISDPGRNTIIEEIKSRQEELKIYMSKGKELQLYYRKAKEALEVLQNKIEEAKDEIDKLKQDIGG